MIVSGSIVSITEHVFDFLWQANVRATLIFCFAAIVVGLWPKSTAAIRHRTWALAFCFAGMVPILTITLPQVPIPLLNSSAKVSESFDDESKRTVEARTSELPGPAIIDRSGENETIESIVAGSQKPEREDVRSSAYLKVDSFHTSPK